jgi:IclR family transcriptional regulator, pca regulon regulatory protein
MNKDVTSAFAIERQDLIAGLGRGLLVIESFDDEHARQTPAEVALRTGLSRTAARRYLLSLCHFGYAATDDKRFWLTPRVLRLGQSYLTSARLPRLAQPFLQQLALKTKEAASLCVIDGHDAIYIARGGSPRMLSAGFSVGTRVPLHCVSAGRVLLATLSDDALNDWIGTHSFSKFTGQTVVGADAFKSEVLQARNEGYAVTDQQLEIGVRGISVALRNRHGECLGAISVTAPVQNLTVDDLRNHVLPLLRGTESEIRGQL